ncbi:Fe-S oxidoreductase [Desulfuromusa kysingii]|uniref:Fe-S oxidoreductase n=1 Tax=Desulfuromusa kysingii TaxID=37625 RepID=A0A1H4A2K8_9BACT|nr:(Fe-S)-binding protein [Desulfuromusa kysingii]SEA30157.1 Fe-S oxidoreductase [Desulfuromusa kysingii]
MNEASARRKIEQFADACNGCGACRHNCFMLGEASMHIGEIARQVLGDHPLQEVLDLVYRCSLCGLCSHKCPLNLNPSLVMEQIREYLTYQPEQQKNLAASVAMQVDREWNYFTLYRDTYAISYDDLFRDHCDTLFIPGCSLSSFSPELVRKSFQWLEDQGLKIGFSDICCSKPLSSLGLSTRAEQMMRALSSQLEADGIKRIVTACPNCHRTFSDFFSSVEVVSIFSLLEKAGVQVSVPSLVSVHDSCPDRNNQAAQKTLRSLLQGPMVEMEHHGAQTLCCGSGGIVSLVDPKMCERRASIRMGELHASGAELCVTTCLACGHRLNRSGEQNRAVHLLELVFNEAVNYDDITFRSRQMWEGEWGAYNMQRLNGVQSAKVADQKDVEKR